MNDMIFAIYLEEINNNLIARRKNDRKAEFPYEKKVELLKEDMNYIPNKKEGNYISLKSYGEGNEIFRNLIIGTYQITPQKTMDIMTRIWNYFFSMHHYYWETDKQEWRIANTWLNWMQDYDFCFLGGEQKYLQNLDCKIVNKEDYRKIRVTSEFNTEYIVKKVLKEILFAKTEKELKKIEKRFHFPDYHNKIYKNKIYDEFYKNNGIVMDLRDTKELVGQLFACILIVIEEKLKLYGIDFEKISHGIELYPAEEQEIVLFNSLSLTSTEKKELYDHIYFKPNIEAIEYKKENDRIFIVYKKERIIEEQNLYELAKFISKYLRKYIVYWLDENVPDKINTVSYKINLEKLSKKINIYGIDEETLKDIKRCVYNTTLTYCITHTDNILKNPTFDKYYQLAEEKIIKDYIEDDYYEKVKEKLASYDKWIGLSRSDCDIVQAILDNPSCTIKEMAELSSFSFNTIKERVDRLRNNGLLLHKKIQYGDLM